MRRYDESAATTRAHSSAACGEGRRSGDGKVTHTRALRDLQLR